MLEAVFCAHAVVDGVGAGTGWDLRECQCSSLALP